MKIPELFKPELLTEGSTHYKNGDIQPIEYIVANRMDFSEGNVIKYITRYRHGKDPIGDLKKARQYIDFLIAFAETKWLGK